MGSMQYAIAAAGLVGACGVALLTHTITLTGPARENAPIGPRAASAAVVSGKARTENETAGGPNSSTSRPAGRPSSAIATISSMAASTRARP